jgi:hypothetical protein
MNHRVRAGFALTLLSSLLLVVTCGGDTTTGGNGESDGGSTKPACSTLDGQTCTGAGVQSCMGPIQSAPCACKEGKYVCHPFCGDPCPTGSPNGKCYDADPTIAPVECRCVETDPPRTRWTCR